MKEVAIQAVATRLLPYVYSGVGVANAQIQEWGSCVVDGVPTLKCLEVVFQNLLFLVSSIVMLILFIMLIVGSFMYLTSGGNPDKVASAQNTIKYAVIGIGLFLGAYLILSVIDVLFLGGEGSIFKFEIPDTT